MKRSVGAVRSLVPILSVALALTALLGGCSSASARLPQGGTEQTEAVENSEPQESVGGWETSVEEVPRLTSEEEGIFTDALKQLDGADYKPVAVLATQLVSGTNYAFLAEGTPIDTQGDTAWFVIVVYRNLDGESSVSCIQEVHVDAMRTLQGAPAGLLLGGWQVKAQTSQELVPEEAGKAFGEASAAYEDVSLVPIATLASQVVSGTNYRVLCEGVPADGDGTTHLLYVAELYVDLDGGAELTNVSQLEFLSYVSPSA